MLNTRTSQGQPLLPYQTDLKHNLHQPASIGFAPPRSLKELAHMTRLVQVQMG
jgi:hypothetical protein